MASLRYRGVRPADGTPPTQTAYLSTETPDRQFPGASDWRLFARGANRGMNSGEGGRNATTLERRPSRGPSAAKRPGIRRRRGADARAGHWRQQHRIQLDQRDASESHPWSVADERAHVRDAGAIEPVFLPRFPGPARRQPQFLGAHRRHQLADEPDREGSPGANLGLAGFRKLFRATRCEADGGPGFPARRGYGSQRSAGGSDQLPFVAGPLRRGSGRSRPDNIDQRSRVHHRRRYPAHFPRELHRTARRTLAAGDDGASVPAGRGEPAGHARRHLAERAWPPATGRGSPTSAGGNGGALRANRATVPGLTQGASSSDALPAVAGAEWRQWAFLQTVSPAVGACRSRTSARMREPGQSDAGARRLPAK